MEKEVAGFDKFNVSTCATSTGKNILTGEKIMFGQNYQFVQPPLKAVTGEYDIILTEVKERDLKGYPVLTFSFSYADGKNRVPNTFDLFDVTDPSDHSALYSFNLKMSKIVLCFGLSGGFDPQNYASWVGKQGRVLITRSKDGFLNVTDFIDKAEIEEHKAQ